MFRGYEDTAAAWDFAINFGTRYADRHRGCCAVAMTEGGSMNKAYVLVVVLLGVFAPSVASQDAVRVLQPDQLCSDYSVSAIATFEDPRLEAQVRVAVSSGVRKNFSPVAEWNLTCNLLSGVELLHVGGGIESLAGIQNLTNLTSLDLDSNRITDIGALSGLTGLTNLRLSANSITDISALSGLRNLTQLRLELNSVTDIGALRELTNLTSLGLDRNSITDVTALNGLTNLTELRLQLNSVADISPLDALENLTLLQLHWNSITDVGALSGLTSLTHLYLSQNPALTDIQPLLDNPGLGAGSFVRLGDTNVDCKDVAGLRAREVVVADACTPRLSSRR